MELHSENEMWAKSPLLPIYYEISTAGRVRSLDHPKYSGPRAGITISRGRILSGSVGKKGYRMLVFRLGKKYKGIAFHRLVMTAFMPNPQKHPIINHRNGDKRDNRIENLEWCSHSWDRKHAWRLGLNHCPNRNGSKNPNTKLTEADILFIRANAKPHFRQTSYKVFAEKYGVCCATIYRIMKRAHWIHL